MPQCVSLPRLPPQPVLLHRSLWRYSGGFSAPQLSFCWRVEVMEKSRSPADDSFHVACPSTRLTSLPHSSAHTFLYFFSPPSGFDSPPFPLSLPLSLLSFSLPPSPLPGLYLCGQAFACLFKPPHKHSFTLPTINVKTRPRASARP